MDRARWFTSDCDGLLGMARNVSDRKYRLFSCACWWQVTYMLRYDHHKRSKIQAVEKYADDLFSRRTALYFFTKSQLGDTKSASMVSMMTPGAYASAIQSHYYCSNLDGLNVYLGHGKRAILCDKYANLFRDIVNPWEGDIKRPLITPQLISLAQAAYNTRVYEAHEALAPSCLAILADCLEEQGADNSLIEHLRDAKHPHYRGCWALDIILNKN